ncbi:hypothetical protein COT29_01625 [Candidatus Micrarchaeota archaeon CG08_land_8_20_14_0_20_59_11]|nr:MAG: hypothetical protein COT29_01625 [Candidatus Micrarchaeota archaeon CG08_land_8_20_14_0_20_59_11]
MDKAVVFVLVSCVLLFGCVGAPQEAASPSPTIIASPTPFPSPSPTPAFAPLKLEYELRTTTDDQPTTINVDYFFEDERTCGGKKAWLGLIDFYEPAKPEEGMWVKASVTLDDGVAGVSQQLSKNELAFDTAHSYRNDLDMAFFMNSLFYAAGENFVNHSVWTSEEPIILKDVTVFGNEADDISVFKKGAGKDATVPCTEFSVVGKRGGNEVLVCVTEPAEKNPLSYVVYFRPGGEAPFGWELKKVGKEKSGVTRILQCLQPVLCDYVPMPSGDERQACESGGKKMQATSDERGCVLRYDCVAAGLKVTIKAPDGSAAPNIEVDLWKKSSSGSPDWAVQTGADGVATFNVLPGEYKIGFNMNGWPQQYKFPTGSDHFVTVPDGGIASAEITLENAS